MTHRHAIFINYRHIDSGYAVGRIDERLAAAFGREAVFRDVDSIPRGTDFRDALQAGIASCRVVIVVIGKDWLRILRERNPEGAGDVAPDQVRIEIETALARYQAKDGVLVYPLMLHETQMPKEKDLPKSLSRLHAMNGTKVGMDPQFDTDMERVIATLANHLGIVPESAELRCQIRFGAPPPSRAHIRWNDELRTYGEGFVGRESELEALDAAWSGHTRIFVLHAEGGAGKTRLAVKWLTNMRDDGWRGACRVFVHSFYLQGRDERGFVSSDQFFEQALAHFGYRGELLLTAQRRAETLASLVAEHRGLLVLDGLEPLQDPLAVKEGRLKDPGVEHLLIELSHAGSGMCLVTSRQPVRELRDRTGAAISQRPLERLDPTTGAALLRQLKVHGSELELRQAVDEAHGHAYSLTLLGSYLHDATPDHDIRRRHEIPLLDQDPQQGLHPRRLFAAYVRHLGEQSPEIAVLRLLGYFDRPAELALIDVLRGLTPLSQSTDNPAPRKGTRRSKSSLEVLVKPLHALSDPDWYRVLARLKTLRLIDTDSSSSGPSVSVSRSLDSHPLLREYFAEEVRTQFPDAWKEGNRRLFEYLCETTPERPEGSTGLQPLYDALAHGVQGGCHQAAYEVYWERIQRGDQGYAHRELALYGAELSAIAHFFEPPFTIPHSEFNETIKAHIMGIAGSRLRSVGRFEDSIIALADSIERYKRLGQSESESYWQTMRMRHLSEAYLALGRLDHAERAAHNTVKNADHIQDWYHRFVGRCVLGGIQHYRGKDNEARKSFQDAKDILTETSGRMPTLYSLWGFRYWEQLLDDGHFDNVLGHAEDAALGWSTGIADRDPEKGLGPLGLLLERLGQLRALLATTHPEDSPRLTEFAKDALSIAAAIKNLGRYDFTPYGLLTYATCLRLSGRFPESKRQVADAYELSARTEMRVFQAECWLECAALFIAEQSGQSFVMYLGEVFRIDSEFAKEADATIRQFIGDVYQRRLQLLQTVEKQIRQLDSQFAKGQE